LINEVTYKTVFDRRKLYQWKVKQNINTRMHPPNDKTKLAESNWEISKQKSPEIKNAQQLLNSYQFSNLLYLQLPNYPIDTAHPQHFLILSFPKPFRWIRMTPPCMPQNHAKKKV